MSDATAATVLMQGAASWNAWREQNRAPLSFAAPQWYDCPGPDGLQIKGRNHLDFSGMDLSGVSIYNAFAEGLNLRNAYFVGAHFEEGDFSRADFSGATFRDTRFNKTIFTGACFEGASFVNCNLNRVNLVGANFKVARITETVVYGIAAWDMAVADDVEQSRLVIEKTYALYSELIAGGTIPLMVDDIELAQFVYYLNNHRKMRDTLNILNDRGVLLLGRFQDGGLERLYRVRDWFQNQGYMPMIFDFARPDNLSLSETVVTMAGLSKFVVADLSGGSVPAELQSILGQIKKPLLAFGDPYALFPDLEDQTAVIAVQTDDARLLAALADELPGLEQLHAERIAKLARRYLSDKVAPLR
ncbi:pentapeptide repeat-containing protein [Parahaliea mediterranea]|uniref:pentapeptide repeat-containing protein n=1 Tax=Parahaliea mediterranea TaxID=651086 RepID=UPI000E2FA9AC|nr:pentapeptide repeat-containing protein [Parahaliea mediterranea]